MKGQYYIKSWIEVFLTIPVWLHYVETTQYSYMLTERCDVRILHERKMELLTECIIFCKSLKSLSSFQNKVCVCLQKDVKKLQMNGIPTHQYLYTGKSMRAKSYRNPCSISTCFASMGIWYVPCGN